MEWLTIDEPSDGNCKELDPASCSASTCMFWSRGSLSLDDQPVPYNQLCRYKAKSIAYGIGVFFIEFSAYDSGWPQSAFRITSMRRKWDLPRASLIGSRATTEGEHIPIRVLSSIRHSSGSCRISRGGLGRRSRRSRMRNPTLCWLLLVSDAAGKGKWGRKTDEKETGVPRIKRRCWWCFLTGR